MRYSRLASAAARSSKWDPMRITVNFFLITKSAYAAGVILVVGMALRLFVKKNL
jgi:hypothetical protein